MKITFLKASIPLTKTFLKTPAGIEKSSYPNVYEVTSIDEECVDLRAFAKLLTTHAALGNCMLKGHVSRALVNESRAGTTDPNATTVIMLLDVDGADFKDPNAFMKAIKLSHLSYVVQYSPSYLIYDKLLRCHIFILLHTPVAAPVLKQFLIAWNFDIPQLKATLALTKTGNALRYGLDITTCQNDKLIYIADPICTGFKAPVHKRIEYIKKGTEALKLPDAPSVMANKMLIESHIADLRKAAKLPERKNTYKLVNNIEILVKPDQSIITGMKVERGFAYFNLNGGDSWGYYHPANNPDFIFNFKGEPTYLTKELLPEYWQQVCSDRKTNKAKNAAPTISGQIYLGFLDKRSSTYWRGVYAETSDSLELHAAKNETQIRHFAAQNGFSLPEYIPEWDVIFDPHSDHRVDVENQKINTFQRTSFMRMAKSSWSSKPTKWPVIRKIMDHALGSDPLITERFINWLATIVQTLSRTRTAWILHGRTGTGKGLLMNRVLGPLFSPTQVAIKRMEELAEPYNGYMEKCFIVFVDEVQTSVLRNERGVMARIKNFITEPTISIRNMYQNAYPVANYTNWIFASNMADPVAVDMNDRRFNVGRYQPEPLIVTPEEIEAIHDELQAFYNHLVGYKIDQAAASTPMDTNDRRNLMSVSESSIDSVATAMLNGDLEFFMDALPTQQPRNAVEFDVLENYKTTLKRIVKRAEDDLSSNISRDELRDIFEYTVGEMPRSPNKFTSRLKHHRIHTQKVRVDGLLAYGVRVQWREIDPGWIARLEGKPVIATSTKAIKDENHRSNEADKGPSKKG